MELDWYVLGDHLLRLTVAVIGGGVLGLDRELGGHWAGLRTHMIVSLGAATFVLLGDYVSGDDPNAIARIIQGVATGVGFLGAGTILKLDDRERIKGLTTAGTIWLAAAIGSVAGLGRYELLIVTVFFAILILVVLRPVSQKLGDDKARDEDQAADNQGQP